MTMMDRPMPTDKRMDLVEVADRIPADGCTLAFGGVTLYRRPMAFALALMKRHARQSELRNLTLLSFTAGLESDILIGTGMVSQVRSCYFGLEAFGLAPHFTEAARQGRVKVVEETEASLAYGLRATLAGVGFMPSTAWQGTDLLRLRPDVKSVIDPYTGETLTAFPAVRCDVAIIHALQSDPRGNAIIGRNWGVDRELALVAERVFLTAEEIVPRLEHADILGVSVEGVVESPDGAWPTSCHPRYPLDGLEILRYLEDVGEDRYPELLARWSRRHHL